MTSPFQKIVTHLLVDCSPRAAKVAIVMADRHNGKNNSKIPFSTREAAAALGVQNEWSARKALNELQEQGLIECVKPASFDFKAGARRAEARLWKLHFIHKRGR